MHGREQDDALDKELVTTDEIAYVQHVDLASIYVISLTHNLSHGGHRDRCEDFAYVVLTEMTKMCYDVSEAEVTRAKNQLKAQMLFTQDSTHRE
jgi:hypothetical protein